MRLCAAVVVSLTCLASGLIWSCSRDTTASDEGKAAAAQAAASQKSTESYAELSAMRPRDRSAEQDYRLAGFLAQMGRKEEAYSILSDAAVKGFSDLDRLRSDTALASLKSDERWPQVELFVDVNGARGSLPDQSANPPKPLPSQRTMPPPAKVNVKAPDWTLPDASGKMVKLSDLRGKVVVMDFWATWCGPCKRSMPEIDKFTRQYAGDELVVLSVNVWERSQQEALDFWNQQDYSMKLLFGNRDLTSAYGIQGIPHLCVIDAEGIIRYSQAGYHPQLVDYLVKWTGAARKQG